MPPGEVDQEGGAQDGIGSKRGLCVAGEDQELGQSL